MADDQLIRYANLPEQSRKQGGSERNSWKCHATPFLEYFRLYEEDVWDYLSRAETSATYIRYKNRCIVKN